MAKNNPWVLRDLATGKASMGPNVTVVASGSHKKSHPRAKRYLGISSQGEMISKSKAKSLGVTSSQINSVKKEADRRASAYGFGAKVKTYSTVKSNPRPPLKSAQNKKKGK